MFVGITLRGLRVDENGLNKFVDEQQTQLQTELDCLGCTLQQVNSSQKLEAHLRQLNINGMDKCLQLWPRTKNARQLALSAEALQEFLFKENFCLSHECQEGFSRSFKVKNVLSDVTTVKKLQKFIQNNQPFPSWDIFGAATGRIPTRKPALNSTPRMSSFRSVVQAPKDHAFIIGDYCRIEIGIIAAISADITMLQNLTKKKDLHIFLASQV